MMGHRMTEHRIWWRSLLPSLPLQGPIISSLLFPCLVLTFTFTPSWKAALLARGETYHQLLLWWVLPVQRPMSTGTSLCIGTVLVIKCLYDTGSMSIPPALGSIGSAVFCWQSTYSAGENAAITPHTQGCKHTWLVAVRICQQKSHLLPVLVSWWGTGQGGMGWEGEGMEVCLGGEGGRQEAEQGREGESGDTVVHQNAICVSSQFLPRILLGSVSARWLSQIWGDYLGQ